MSVSGLSDPGKYESDDEGLLPLWLICSSMPKLIDQSTSDHEIEEMIDDNQVEEEEDYATQGFKIDEIVVYMQLRLLNVPKGVEIGFWWRSEDRPQAVKAFVKKILDRIKQVAAVEVLFYEQDEFVPGSAIYQNLDRAVLPALPLDHQSIISRVETGH